MYGAGLVCWALLVAAFFRLMVPPAVQVAPPAALERGHIVTRDGQLLAHDGVNGRVYPLKTSAAALIGFMGRSEGLEGIEFSHDGPLRAGETVTLSIHSAVQAMTERALAEASGAVDAEFASGVVLDVTTGRVVAAATYPSFDPNAWRRAAPEQWRSRAFLDEYEPGSVMKPLIVAALLNDGATTPDREYDTPMRRRVGSATIGDLVPHPPRLSTQQILRYSSNVGMTQLVESFTPEQMHAYLQAYGFGRPQSAGVASGRGRLRPPEAWDDVIRATNAFGQGLTVTTVQMAAAFNVLANDGQYVSPTLLMGVAPVRRQVLRPDVARTARQMLHAVIDEGISRQAGVPGYHLGGKTGTAQVAENGRYSARVFTSTFAGFIPADRPQYTVAIMVRGAKRNYQGSQLAAPIFREIATDLMSMHGTLPQPEHPTAVRPTPGPLLD